MTRTSKLQRELKQNRPFRSAGQEAAVGLIRTAAVLRRYYAKCVEASGVTMPQYNALRILRGAGEGGLPALAIAERMVEEVPGITRMLDRLEAKKWVTRERSSSDRRQVICRLTDSGLALLASLDAVVDGADDNALAMLNEKDLERFIQLMDRVRAGHADTSCKNIKGDSK